jgi:HD superfamily phosphodiesterase
MENEMTGEPLAQDMIENIKSMILDLCASKDWDWKTHIETVVKYSKSYAIELGADEEICEISAWLHDISKLKGVKEKHHVSGSEEAAEILKGYGYPPDRIEKIRHCILTHSSDKNHVPESSEAKIVACADALSHLDNFLALSYYVYHLKNKSIEEGRVWIVKKYQACWAKLDLVPESKEMVGPKYESIKFILGQKE